MVEFKTAKCPKCGKLAEIIFSNNPLVPGICLNCIDNELDYNNIKQADFFCRTYNIPFDPERWVELAGKVGKQVFKVYTQQFFETDRKNLYYQKVTADLWGKLDEEWQTCRTFEELLNKVKTIKNQFVARNVIKWGEGYTFEEYLKLENLLVSTLRANDITIIAGDSKAIKELSSAYSSFTKTAQIDDIITSANSDVIASVADLGQYIEQCGGEFTFYDNVSRDIVDKTINDLKQYTKTLVTEATGLGSVLENISSRYRESLEQQASEEATSTLSIDEIISDNASGENHEFDAELGQDTLDDIVLDDDDE